MVCLPNPWKRTTIGPKTSQHSSANERVVVLQAGVSEYVVSHLYSGSSVAAR